MSEKGGFKKQQGVALPSKLDILHNGKKVVTAKFSNIELKDKLDAALFTKP